MNIFQTLADHRRLQALLRATPKTQLSSAARASIRRQVERAIINRGPVELQPVHGFMVPAWATAVGAAVVVLVIGTGTLAAAQSPSTGPGDWLYGLDRALERTHMVLTPSLTTKADIAASIAEERQMELEVVNDQRPTDDVLVTQAQSEADTALDRAIEAVGKVSTNSEKNRAAISARAAAKVQHLIDIREKIRAKKLEQQNRRHETSDDQSSTASPTIAPANTTTVPTVTTPSASTTGIVNANTATELPSLTIQPSAAPVKTQSTSQAAPPIRSKTRVQARSTSTLSPWLGLGLRTTGVVTITSQATKPVTPSADLFWRGQEEKH